MRVAAGRRLTIPIPQFVVDKLRAGHHYVRTGIAICGDELVAVSEEYLRACLASRKELVLGGVGGFLLGVGIVQVAVTLTTTSSWLRATVGIALMLVGGLLWAGQWKIRKTRRLFRKSEEARRV